MRQKTARGKIIALIVKAADGSQNDDMPGCTADKNILPGIMTLVQRRHGEPCLPYGQAPAPF
jgi:hypothetical protein